MNWRENQRKDTVISSFNKAVNKKTDINPNGVQITKTCLKYMGLHQRKDTVILSFNKAANKKSNINPNGVQIRKTCSKYTGLHII